ncbi:hypothetical protein LY78DRAFT_79090 [Colletotrichum sublineola]|nr:hypothetical protein LY78DRAFT_79090 [Colletotrichum sublineola]
MVSDLLTPPTSVILLSTLLPLPHSTVHYLRLHTQASNIKYHHQNIVPPNASSRLSLCRPYPSNLIHPATDSAACPPLPTWPRVVAQTRDDDHHHDKGHSFWGHSTRRGDNPKKLSNLPSTLYSRLVYLGSLRYCTPYLTSHRAHCTSKNNHTVATTAIAKPHLGPWLVTHRLACSRSPASFFFFLTLTPSTSTRQKNPPPPQTTQPSLSYQSTAPPCRRFFVLCSWQHHRTP